MNALARHANEDGLVLFVGAGVSMLPPTSLPSWRRLNQMTLTALCERVGKYIHSPVHTENLLKDLANKRDLEQTFAPDYQAQLMVEECDSEYFKVLEALDTETHNPCHEAIAQLAKRGKLEAILTTNYDRLCELALAAGGVEHRVYFDPQGFQELKRSYEESPNLLHLPVVKIHGTVDFVDSMVDTLQQRIQGRGGDLPIILDRLLRAHHWVFLGFSGADFDYDPDYLCVRKATDGGRGFTFVTRPGEKARESVKKLIAAYGDRARLAEADLPGWLFELIASVDPSASAVLSAPQPKAGGGEVRSRIKAWAGSLDMMQVIATLSALLSGANANIETYKLLRLVWRHYRTTEDSQSKSYGRFCYRFGTSLLEHGVTPDENWDGAARATIEYVLPSEGGGADFQLPRDDAFQFLARAKKVFGVEEATPNLALACACRGDFRNANAGVSVSLKFAADTESSRVWSDAVHAAAIIKYLQKEWTAGGEILARSYGIIRWDGDEPRRARYQAWLGAYMAWGGGFDTAEQVIREGLKISDSLDLEVTRADNLWALGVLETEKRNAEQSFQFLDKAWSVFERNVLRPRMILTYLEATRAIGLPSKDVSFCERAVDRFLEMQKVVDELLENEVLFGFLPAYSLANYYYFWNLSINAQQDGEPDLRVKLLRDAQHSLEDARRFAENQHNEGVLETAAREEPDVLAELKTLGLSP